jgi:hypothetical protein
MNIPITKYILFAAMRDKLMLSLVVASLVIVSMSFFLGSSAVVEQDQFVLIYIASTLRLLFVFGISLFVVFFIRRSFENKDIEYLLSRPVGRIQFVISYIVGLIVLCSIFSIFAAGIIAFISQGFDAGAALWMYSLFCELVIMSVAALFFAMALSSPVTAILVTISFYVLSRLIGNLLGIADDFYSGTSFELMSNGIKALSSFVPRFDLMTQSSWLLYGAEGAVGYGFVTVQGIIFVAILSCAAMIDLVRRQF